MFMEIYITPELEQFIKLQVQSGRYSSTNELVGEALQLLAQRDDLRQKRRQTMDKFIDAGLDADGKEVDDAAIFWSEIEEIVARAERGNG